VWRQIARAGDAGNRCYSSKDVTSQTEIQWQPAEQHDSTANPVQQRASGPATTRLRASTAGRAKRQQRDRGHDVKEAPHQTERAAKPLTILPGLSSLKFGYNTPSPTASPLR